MSTARSRPPSRDFLPTVCIACRFDWTAAHFGYPGRARFYHTVLASPRYVKIFTPNPTALADGGWRDNRGAAEVTFYLLREQKPAFERELRARCCALGLSGEFEMLEGQAT